MVFGLEEVYSIHKQFCVSPNGFLLMEQSPVLVSWIGHADILSMLEDIPSSEAEKLIKLATIPHKKGEKPGPLKTAIASGRFTLTHLLSNFPKGLNERFAQWLGGEIHVHPVELSNPTDYKAVFEASDHALADITKRSPSHRHSLFIHLSSGTPAMTAVWVLLGKSRYPARFIQTHKNRVFDTQIPFDLTVDYLPEVLRTSDSALLHLAARSPAEVDGFNHIIGESQPIRLAVGRAAKAALRNVPILITGESGTGKELFARAIHEASPRRNGPFEAINCAAIPRELLESELFGHVKGAFTGAASDRKGAFGRADGGTLFLDEIGECELALQTKLLRVLQPPPGKSPSYREFFQVGGHKPAKSDVRIVAATNRDLIREMEQGKFREDLYYRLAVITLNLPALRDRRKDLPLLVDFLLKQINHDFRQQEQGYQDKKISGSAIEFVKSYHWPGNVRQLFNTLVQSAVMAEGDIQKSDLIDAIGKIVDQSLHNPLEVPLGDDFDMESHLNKIQIHYLKRAMLEAKGNKTQAARLLGMKNYQTLDAQLKRFKIRGKWET